MNSLTKLRRASGLVAWTLAFALAYAQSPLYTSNQNQYFLHGLARAGVGFLRNDWLANTIDPTPLFSMLVQALADAPWVFYFVYAALMGVYLFSMASILGSIFDLSTPTARRLLLAGLVILHSAGVRYLLARLAPEAEFVLEGGVAGQRLLGAVLQPSAFGVLLVASLALFLSRRPLVAIVCLAAACAVHPTYLLSAGILLAGYGIAAWRERWSLRRAAALAVLGLALLGAVAVPVYLTFRPGGPDLYARAAEILIRGRIPHHAIPEKWLDGSVALQAVLVGVALWLTRRSRMFPILATSTAGVTGLTAAQMISGSVSLALLFPWRLSTVLIPVSTGVVFAAALSASARRIQARPTRRTRVVALAAAGVLLAIVAGVARFTVELGHQGDDPAGPMMDFVAASVGPGQVYFIDPKLQDFRLRTGAPVVVDAKAIPYADRQVVEWWDRLKLARDFFRDRPEQADCGTADQARNELGATHVVLGPELLGLRCPLLAEMYNDGVYAVYRMVPPSPPLAPGGTGVIPAGP